MATAYATPLSPHEFGPPSSRRDFPFGGHDPSQWTPEEFDASLSAHQPSQHRKHHNTHHPSRTLDSVPTTIPEYPLPSHSHSHSQEPIRGLAGSGTISTMKGRPRGESDLGRPAMGRTHSLNGRPRPSLDTRQRTLSSVSEPSRAGSEGLRAQLFTALLITAPFLLSTFLSPPRSLLTLPSQAETKLPGEAGLSGSATSHITRPLQACALAAGTLLLTGCLGHVRGPEPIAAIAKSGVERLQPNILSTAASLKLVAFRCLSVLLPFIAAAEIGGTRTALIILVGIAAEVFMPVDFVAPSKSWRDVVKSKKWCCLLFLLAFTYDLAWKPAHAEYGPIFRGYLALVKAALFLQPPLPTLLPDTSKLSVVRNSVQAAGGPEPGLSTARARPTSVLVATAADINLTIVAGVALAAFTALLAVLMNVTVASTWVAPAICLLSIASAAGLLTMSTPHSLQTSHRLGLALGMAFVVISGWFHEFYALEPGMALGAFASLAFLAIRLDSPSRPAHSRENSQTYQTHHHHHHHHHHSHATPSDVSAVTKFFLSHTEGWPLLHSVLASPDSRSIFYFLCINFAFMLIQLFYSIVSESLGLLSDSIHMFFDCFGMLVGLFAAVMTKWPASDRFPYGFGKVNTLSGFANGVFLIFVSIEFIWDSVERFIEGVQLKRVEELFVISVLGLVVNLIGLKLTHGHHGHDHGHDHSHNHSPANQYHSAVSEPSGGHLDLHDPSKSPLTPAIAQVQQHHGHHDHHGDDNMLGIYLHILADTMGSVAVIVSTALTYLTGYSIWDPLASCIIAILIIVASYPLVRSSAKKLLLTVPDDVEWKLRETLQELSGLKGVAGYGGPRFWIDDSEVVQSIGHGHDCGAHAHSHDDEHHHDHHHDDASDSPSHASGRLRILGVIHIIASRSADLDDVRKQVSQYLNERDMNVVVHVEREGEGRCWCGGDKSAIAT